jgi:hypothetical protein
VKDDDTSSHCCPPSRLPSAENIEPIQLATARAG